VDISINNVNDIGRAHLHRYEASEAQKTLGVPGRSDRWNWGVIDCMTTDCWLKELLKYMSQHDFLLANTLPVLRTF
jgi:hypothetical protein